MVSRHHRMLIFLSNLTNPRSNTVNIDLYFAQKSAETLNVKVHFVINGAGTKNVKVHLAINGSGTKNAKVHLTFNLKSCIYPRCYWQKQETKNQHNTYTPTIKVKRYLCTNFMHK